jgi:ATP-binding cassette subfamily F protein 3
MEIENRKNAQLSKEILAKKEQANAFAMKGGNLRAVAKRMRELAADLEEEKVDVRKEDRTIKAFTIPVQPDINGDIIIIDSVSVLKNSAAFPKNCQEIIFSV